MISDEIDFSSLKTVSKFDRGEECTLALRVDSDDLQKFSPSSLLVESLIEQLCKLVEKNPKKRRKLYLDVCEKLHQMNLIDENYGKEEFEFMRSYYQKALYQFLTTAKATSIDNQAAIVSSVPDRLVNIPSKDVIEWSRYSTEFDELDYIAKGGFGHVYKVQHKLDGGLYAVKKIFLRYYNVSDFLQNLKEVKMLAKLNHPNIVSYKAAWLEPFNKKKKTTSAIEISRDSTVDDSLEVVFESSVASSRTEDMSEQICKYSSNSVDVFCRYKYDLEETVGSSECAILYIQMQLCQQTLRQWLDIRNLNMQEVNLHQCNDIFRQIVKGVEYIHSQGIVHHDIKPSNVFVSHDLKQIQVGDFGLACSLLTHQPPLSVIETHQPGQLGTKLYAAPEQLSGYCHPKSDVYSLGIIFFELIQPFTTAMERSKVIGQLKGGHIPSELVSSYPLQANTISQTVCRSIKKRPSSSELLAALVESQNTDTQRVLAEQSETIKRLRRESMEKDDEIASLREQLQILKLQRM